MCEKLGPGSLFSHVTCPEWPRSSYSPWGEESFPGEDDEEKKEEKADEREEEEEKKKEGEKDKEVEKEDEGRLLENKPENQPIDALGLGLR